MSKTLGLPPAAILFAKNRTCPDGTTDVNPSERKTLAQTSDTYCIRGAVGVYPSPADVVPNLELDCPVFRLQRVRVERVPPKRVLGHSKRHRAL
eukprot:scaffold5816_cov267-Pinguiococcus_pyrenoidosus.AAC.2